MDDVRLYIVDKGALITDQKNVTLYAHLAPVGPVKSYKDGCFTDEMRWRVMPRVRLRKDMTDEEGDEVERRVYGLFSPGDKVHLIFYQKGMIAFPGGNNPIVVSSASEFAYDKYEAAAGEYRKQVEDYDKKAKLVRAGFDARFGEIWEAKKRALEETKAKLPQDELEPFLSARCSAALAEVRGKFLPQLDTLEEEVRAELIAQIGERPFLELILQAA
jgi:hypothetical protein